MKILPKKIDIDKAKADERKREIDDGIALARRVDALRELKTQEERNLSEYRISALRIIQNEIDAELKKRDDQVLENKTLEQRRKELIKPLNEEWKKIYIAKDEVEVEKRTLSNLAVMIQKGQEEMENEKKTVTQNAKLVTKNLEQSELEKQAAMALKEEAKKQKNLAEEERYSQKEAHEQRILDLDIQATAYQNGININEMVAKQNEEEKKDLITRERRLASQQRIFKIAMESVKKNAKS